MPRPFARSLVFTFALLLGVFPSHPADASRNEYDDIIEQDLEQQALKKQTDTVMLARRQDGSVIGIMLEGEIKAGDYDAFTEIVKIYSGTLNDVYLYSPGGSAVEAIKIGRLIRHLKMKTHAPFGSPPQGACLPRPKNPKNCTCQSACFLVHVAGVERTGTVLGIHRILVKHEVLKNMSAADASKAASDIKKLVTAYLPEMGVPSSYVDRVLSTPSGKMEFLEAAEIEKHFTGFVHEYSEWITAKCGDGEKLVEASRSAFAKSKYKNKNLTTGELMKKDPEYAEAERKVNAAIACSTELGKKLTSEAYVNKFSKK